MKINICPKNCSFVLILFLLLVTGWFIVEAESHNHMQTGNKHHHQNPKHHPPNPKHHPPNKPKDCNHILPKCSAEVPHGGTKAILTQNSFKKGGDGGGPSECGGKFHSDDSLVVALSTSWFANKKRCFPQIIINGNGRTVKAMVVDECDSRRGCKYNIVDASAAVWKALGVPKKGWGELSVTWSDA